MCNYFHSLFDSLRLHNYNLKSEVKGIKISVDRIVSCDFNTLIWWCSFSQALSELVLIFIASCLSFMYLTEADPLQKKKKTEADFFFSFWAVGDLHGDLKQARYALEMAGVLSSDGQDLWTGGKNVCLLSFKMDCC